MKDKSRTDVIHHISRLEGQLESVKNELQTNRPDCEKASKTLFAASRSFASLRKSFLQCFLGEKYLRKNVANKRSAEYEALLKVISS